MSEAPFPTVGWNEFARAEPELARFGRDRLTRLPAYLATIRGSGEPRVHPVTPIIGPSGLCVFMEPTSPKARDLRERGWFAMHSGVQDDAGTGGEFWTRGRGLVVEDREIRLGAVEAASYAPDDRYILFELLLGEARCNGYGDVNLPAVQRWSAGPPPR